MMVGHIHVLLLSVGLFPLCLVLTECSLIHLSGSDCWLNDHMTHLSLSLTRGCSCFGFYFLYVIMMPSIQTDATWTKCAGAAELWRIDKVEEDEATFDAQLTRTENTMSTLVRQERTICVLLPNKDQLDIAVGVSVYMWASLVCPHYGEWHFGCTTLSLDWFVMQIFSFVFVHLLTAQIHRARCLQPRGWTSGNQRAALLWPHDG